jgi:hypothetical protein
VADARDAALGIATMCGQLPLAIRIAGARLRARPHLTLERFSSRLADERSRLDALAVGDREVRSSLAVSHRVLDPQARRLFRLIAVLTAPEVTVWSAAALLDLPEPQGEELVEELVEARLLDVARVDGSGTVHVGMHDLVRLYAREQAAAAGTTADDGAALERAFGAALYLAERAQEGLPGGLPPLARGRAPRWPVSSAMVEQVRDDPVGWFESERAGLVAAVEQAATLGLDELAWDLACCLGRFLEMRGYFDDWRIVQDAALVAVRAAGNTNGEACLLCATGERHIDQDRYGDALEAFTKALATFESLGDATVRHTHVAPSAAPTACWGAWTTPWAASSRSSPCSGTWATPLGWPKPCTALAWCTASTAETALQEGLDACRRIGHAHGEVFALAHLGELHTRRGETRAALERLHAALAICGEVVERAGERRRCATSGSCTARWASWTRPEPSWSGRSSSASRCSGRSGRRRRCGASATSPRRPATPMPPRRPGGRPTTCSCNAVGPRWPRRRGRCWTVATSVTPPSERVKEPAFRWANPRGQEAPASRRGPGPVPANPTAQAAASGTRTPDRTSTRYEHRTSRLGAVGASGGRRRGRVRGPIRTARHRGLQPLLPPDNELVAG